VGVGFTQKEYKAREASLDNATNYKNIIPKKWKASFILYSFVCPAPT
jgi:hypothetical protein